MNITRVRLPRHGPVMLDCLLERVSLIFCICKKCIDRKLLQM